MSGRKKGGSASPPPMPPETVQEQMLNADMIRRLEEISAFNRQRNLDNAVRLAQMAARHQGPLVDHFAELGRRFAELSRGGPPKPQLRVIKGGEA
jgi:hypothetical protein